MKRIIILLISVLGLGCSSRSHDSIIADKYLEDFNRFKYSLSYNSEAKRDKDLLDILDEVILETEKNRISYRLKECVVKEVHGIPKPRMSEDLERYNELIKLTCHFQKRTTHLIDDLDFIDKFLKEKYWQYWQCNSGYHKTEVLLQLDTIYLEPNKEYELPIRVDYNNLPAFVSILSNSLQGNKPKLIKFKTDGLSVRFQKIEYDCKVINVPTGTVMQFESYFVVKLVRGLMR